MIIYTVHDPFLANLAFLALKASKAGQTEFAVYRHRPHGFSDFPKNFQSFRSNTVKYTGLGRTLSSALISGRGSGDLELDPSLSNSLKSE